MRLKTRAAYNIPGAGQLVSDLDASYDVRCSLLAKLAFLCQAIARARFSSYYPSHTEKSQRLGLRMSVQKLRKSEWFKSRLSTTGMFKGLAQSEWALILLPSILGAQFDRKRILAIAMPIVSSASASYRLMYRMTEKQQIVILINLM